MYDARCVGEGCFVVVVVVGEQVYRQRREGRLASIYRKELITAARLRHAGSDSENYYLGKMPCSSTVRPERSSSLPADF